MRRFGTLTAFLAVIVFLFPASGWASFRTEIFSAENRARLCLPEAENVDRGALALLLIEHKGFPWTMFDGILLPSDGSIYLTVDNLFTQKAIAFFRDPDPFGPRPDPETNPQIAKFLEMRKTINDNLVAFLNSIGRPKFGYKTVGASEIVNEGLATVFFKGTDQIRIACTPTVASDQLNEAGSGSGKPDSFMSFLGENFRLLGSVEDLAKPKTKSQLSKASPAQVSFRDNQEKGTETLEVNIVTGVKFRHDDDDWTLSAVPYIHYQSSDTTVSSGPDTKVESFTGGLLLDWFQTESSSFNWELGIRPSIVFDLEQDAESLRLDATFEPTIAIGEHQSFKFILGGYNPLVSDFLTYRPDLIVLGQAAYVLDSGKSPDLGGNDEYLGLGIEPSISLRFLSSVLKNFRIQAKVRYMELFDTNIESIARFETGIEYLFGGSEHYTVGFSYINGENTSTFQDEEYLGLSLGLKF